MTTGTRFAAGVITAIVMIFGMVSPAAADPPGPTDFRTEVLSITPSTDAFTIEIVGGDSFVLLRQVSNDVIEVLGYNGEPYLRFASDGTVERNRRSPATYLNEERFGDTIPDIADAEAAPEWETVSSDGSYAWHDHRAHWMLQSTPFGLGPGDQILEAVIPIQVGGDDIDLLVGSFWEQPPSLLPIAMGALAGLLLAFVTWRRGDALFIVLSIGSLVALIAGGVQYLSVPPETGPSFTIVAIPVIALTVGLGAWVSRGRPATALPLAIGSAAALITFAALRLPNAHKAILPTDLSMPLDRAISGGVMVIGCACLLVGGRAFLRLIRTDPINPAASPSMPAG